MPKSARNSRLPRKVLPRLKLWFEIGDRYVFGRGIRDILQEVDETGSIKAAATRVGKSYRFVWSRIKDAEAAMGAPLVIARVGGRDARRSALTSLARDLVLDFDGIHRHLSEVLDRQSRKRILRTLERHADPG